MPRSISIRRGRGMTQSRRLFLERLENRTLLATITVTGTGDTIAIDGLATLREAITSINNQADVNADMTLNRVGLYASQAGGTPDVINFSIAGAGVKTIAVTGSAEPTIIMPLTINGYSQTGASANTLANADNAVILIQLDGAGAGADGLTLGAGSGGSVIRGLDIIQFPGNGIVIQSNNNSIRGNFIGVGATGEVRLPNGTFPTSGDGVRIVNASSNLVGSTDPADRNIVSGNAIDGIHIIGSLIAPAIGNLIQGNFVGVAADGVSNVGNRTEPAPAPGAAEGNNLFGIEISGGNLNIIGGDQPGARNVIGFNADGIELDNGSQRNIILGNFVGVGADGVTPAANLLHGVALRSSNGFGPPLGPAQPNEPGVSFNKIGSLFEVGNFIAFNGQAGIAVFGNPVSASGQPNIGNTIEDNSIFQNGRSYLTASSAPTPLLGIDLTNQFPFPRDDGVTPNDSQGHGGPDDPNNFQNFPVLTSAITSGGTTTITGTLHADPNTRYLLEFFANDPDPLGLPAEGQQLITLGETTTDASGNASFSITSGSVAISPARTITATATDPIGNTSEFSAAQAVTQGLPECDIEAELEPGHENTAVLLPDPDDPGENLLLVTGTARSDVILIEPRPSDQSQIRVRINGHLAGFFDRVAVPEILVFGLGGNDKIVVSAALDQETTIFGDSGNDVIIAGSGDTQIAGGAGNDKIVGGRGNDTLCGDNGNDVIVGGLGNDTIFGDAGNDVINGGVGDDLLLGGDGNDVLDGAVGSDRLYGQAGNDTL
ncbi:MAG TPA: hypothetical protein VKH44_12585, partial [Pirellulaceae bacterium]|nr:hypothetical protein [Pirellulaceae bacterium]